MCTGKRVPGWTLEEQAAARGSGWSLVWNDDCVLEVRRCERFDSDAEALAHVERHAAAGFKLEEKALMMSKIPATVGKLI